MVQSTCPQCHGEREIVRFSSFTNSHKQRRMVRARFSDLKCDHLWFYGEPHSRLQRKLKFGDLMQGDWNQVDVKSTIGQEETENTLL